MTLFQFYPPAVDPTDSPRKRWAGYVVTSSVYREPFDGVGAAGIEPAMR